MAVRHTSGVRRSNSSGCQLKSGGSGLPAHGAALSGPDDSSQAGSTLRHPRPERSMLTRRTPNPKCRTRRTKMVSRDGAVQDGGFAVQGVREGGGGSATREANRRNPTRAHVVCYGSFQTVGLSGGFSSYASDDGQPVAQPIGGEGSLDIPLGMRVAGSRNSSKKGCVSASIAVSRVVGLYCSSLDTCAGHRARC